MKIITVVFAIYLCCVQGDLLITDEYQQCFTSDGYLGTCTDYSECPALTELTIMQMLENNIKITRCDGPFENGVCCYNPGVKSLSQCEQMATPPNPNSGCCGIHSSIENKIFGGNAVPIDAYPWMAIIDYKMLQDITFICQGSLISSKYVLTAANCVVGRISKLGIPNKVRLGEYNLLTDGPDCVEADGGGEDCTDGVITIPIEKYTPHPDYKYKLKLKRHNIALIRLLDNAPYTDFIRPICLPTLDIQDALHLKKDVTFYVAGWGKINKLQYSDIKLHVRVPYKTLQECQKQFNRKLWKDQICAGGEAGEDSCEGDLGGPLMYQNYTTYILVGIVNFGPVPCGLGNYPAVYTNVYEYLPWIWSQIKH